MNNQIRVLFENETMMVSTIEEAQQLADNKQLDLVNMAPNVYRIMDYNKYMYNKQQQIKKQPKTETKELQLGLSIAQNDLSRKINDTKKWLSKGCHVRIIVKLRGREQSRPEVAVDLLQNILAEIDESLLSEPIKKIEKNERNVSIILKGKR